MTAISNWPGFLSALVLVLIRVSGMMVFAPFFSSNALPVRARAAFALAMAYLLAPLTAALPHARADLGVASVLGEIAIGLIYGLSLALLTEMLVFAGQIAGTQLSFSLVNLLDPSSSIETPLMGNLFQTLGLLVVIAAGLDRILLASVVRSFHAVPLGTYVLPGASGVALARAAGGVFLAAIELVAPLLAATMLAEVAVALMGKLSPQLPVMSLAVPLKTLTGFGVLIGSLALWPRFIEARFSGLLDFAEHLISTSGTAITGAGG